MKKSYFNYDQLIECAKGILFGKGNAQLPMPPMLMLCLLYTSDAADE